MKVAKYGISNPLDGWNMKDSRIYNYLKERFPGLSLPNTAALYNLIVKKDDFTRYGNFSSNKVFYKKQVLRDTTLRLKVMDEYLHLFIPILDMIEESGIICVPSEIDQELGKYNYYVKFTGDPNFYMLSPSGSYTSSLVNPRERIDQVYERMRQFQASDEEEPNSDTFISRIDPE